MFVIRLYIYVLTFTIHLFVLYHVVRLSLSNCFAGILLQYVNILVVTLPLPLVLLCFLSSAFVGDVVIYLSNLLTVLFSSCIVKLISGREGFVGSGVLLFLGL